MNTDTPPGQLTRGQTIVLATATLPMIGAGIAGAWGTYTNIDAEFDRAATALGVVAAGEGVTLVLALVMVGLTMLGQSSPAPVRAGLWLAPVAAALTGVIVADDLTEAVVYALTPMGMSASAEGLGLLARRIVVHRTGIDMEVQRRNAETVQRLAYHRARAVNHPNNRARKRSERASWRLAKRVGLGDAELGARLVEVQRERLREGADAALLDMLSVDSERAEPVSPVTPGPLEEVTPQQDPALVIERVEVSSDTPPEVSAPPAAAPMPALTAPPVEPLVICGDRKVWPLSTPPADTEGEVSCDPKERLPADAARVVIESCWAKDTPATETARLATRSVSYVKKVFARLDDERGPQPAPGQMVLVQSEVAS